MSSTFKLHRMLLRLIDGLSYPDDILLLVKNLVSNGRQLKMFKLLTPGLA